MFNYILNYSKINFINFYFLLILIFFPYLNIYVTNLNFFYFLIFAYFILKSDNSTFNSFYLKINFIFYLKINFIFYLKINFIKLLNLILNFFKNWKNFTTFLKVNYFWNPLIKQYSYYGYFKSNTNLWNINYSEEFKKIKF